MNLRAAFIIFLGTFQVDVHSQTDSCRKEIMVGRFALELSFQLWSSDDMILRRSSLFTVYNDSLNLENGILYFENDISLPLSCKSREDWNVRYFSFSLNDSLHSILMDKCSNIIDVDGYYYKLFDLKLEVIPLGFDLVQLFVDEKWIERSLPTFLVTDFRHIQSVCSDD